MSRQQLSEGGGADASRGQPVIEAAIPLEVPTAAVLEAWSIIAILRQALSHARPFVPDERGDGAFSKEDVDDALRAAQQKEEREMSENTCPFCAAGWPLESGYHIVQGVPEPCEKGGEGNE